MTIKQVFRGEIYLCKFGKGYGSQQGGTRPVVVLQNDVGNRFSPTTIVAVITSKQKGNYPMHSEIENGIAGLTEDSTVLCEQIFTVDKTRFIKKIGDLNEHTHLLGDINEAIKVSLDL